MMLFARRDGIRRGLHARKSVRSRPLIACIPLDRDPRSSIVECFLPWYKVKRAAAQSCSNPAWKMTSKG
jgi:hypothetical protein